MLDNPDSSPERALELIHPIFNQKGVDLLRSNAPDGFELDVVVEQMGVLRERALEIFRQITDVLQDHPDILSQIVPSRPRSLVDLLEVYDWLRSAMERLEIPLGFFTEAFSKRQKRKIASGFEFLPPDVLSLEQRNYAELKSALQMLVLESERIYEQAVADITSLGGVVEEDGEAYEQFIDNFIRNQMFAVSQETLNQVEAVVGVFPVLSVYLEQLQFWREEALVLARMCFLSNDIMSDLESARDDLHEHPVSEEEQVEMQVWLEQILRGELLFVSEQRVFDYSNFPGDIDMSTLHSILVPPSRLSDDLVQSQGAFVLLKAIDGISRAFLEAFRAEQNSLN